MKLKEKEFSASFSCTIKAKTEEGCDLLDDVMGSLNIGAATLKLGNRTIYIDAIETNYSAPDEDNEVLISCTLAVDEDLMKESEEDLLVDDLKDEKLVVTFYADWETDEQGDKCKANLEITDLQVDIDFHDGETLTFAATAE
jgi:hypothetical protein